MPGVKRFDDLLCWKLAYQLSVDVFEAAARPPASRDFTFTSQNRDASDSAQRNIAEGFGRCGPIEFARFLDVVRASLNETIALTMKARSTRYFSEEQASALNTLAVRSLQAVAGFQRYLRLPAANRNATRIRNQLAIARSTPNVPNDPNE